MGGSMRNTATRALSVATLSLAAAIQLSSAEPAGARGTSAAPEPAFSSQPGTAAAAQPAAPPSAPASGPAAGVAPPSPPGASATLTGTVRSYDARARTLELIAGVGMALRVVRISCPEGTPVRAEGAAAGLSRLKPGDVVRVDYARTPKENVAKSIDLLPKPKPGGAP